jgi:hypothetical protein
MTAPSPRPKRTDEMMTASRVTIAIRLDHRYLANPDLDIRYVLPALLGDQCGATEDGYDYVGGVPHLVLFVEIPDTEEALKNVIAVIESETVLGNDLRQAAVIAVKRDSRFDVVYPADFSQSFGVYD